MQVGIRTRFLLFDKTAHFMLLQGKQDRIKINVWIVLYPLVVNRFDKNVVKVWFLTCPKIIIGLEGLEIDTQLVCVFKCRHADSLADGEQNFNID